MKTGRPQVVDRYSTAHQGEDVNTTNICPAALGTKDQRTLLLTIDNLVYSWFQQTTFVWIMSHLRLTT